MHWNTLSIIVREDSHYLSCEILFFHVFYEQSSIKVWEEVYLKLICSLWSNSQWGQICFQVTFELSCKDYIFTKYLVKIRARLLFFWPHYEYPTNLLTIKGGASRCLFRCQIGNLGIIDLNFESVKIHTIWFFGTFFVPFFSDTFRQYSSFSYFCKKNFLIKNQSLVNFDIKLE